MNCEEVQVYLEGCGAPLTPPSPPWGEGRARGVAEHLRQCATCAEYAARLAVENRVLEETLSKPPAEERWQRVKAGLERRMALELASARRRHRAVWAMAAAAAVVLCFGAGFLAYRRLKPSGELAAGQTPPRSGGPAQAFAGALASGLARLQEEVRSRQLLDELEQLQIVFRETGDADGRSVAEDAELYVERILSLDGSRPEQAGEILAGIKAAGIQRRMRKVRESIADDAPAPLRASLELAATTLDKAAVLAAEK